MSSQTRNRKISSLYNPVTNPSGGLTGAPLAPFQSLFGGLAYRGEPTPAPAPAPQLGPDARTIALGGRAPAAPLGPDARTVALGGRAAPAPSSPGSYNGVAIRPGTDAEIAAQMRAVDARRAGSPAPAAPGDGPQTGGGAPRQWLNPDGSFKSPNQVAEDIAGTLRGVSGEGDVGRMAREDFASGQKSAAELETDARRVNNVRNDIAVGEADPYKVASKSGVSYTPAELRAIESAYAGVYDPALDSAMSRLNQARADEEAAREAEAQAARDKTQFDNDLVKMEKQFGYDRALKQTPTGNAAAGSGVGGGGYVPGENPAVDAWAQRIFDGSAKITDIPASQKGMRDAVVVALQASGNTLAGKPTVTELGRNAAAAAKGLIAKMDSGQGTSAVGGSRLFGGAIAAATPGTDAANFSIDFQNLKDTLSLDGVKYLKGQGAVSDAERALLASAVTKLNLSQSEGEFKKTLQGIVDRLEGSADAASLPATMVLNGQTLYLQPDGTYE